MVHQALDAKNFIRNQKKRFICEIHRDMYEILIRNPQKNKVLLDLLFEAYASGVKMNDKLQEYAGKKTTYTIFEDKK